MRFGRLGERERGGREERDPSRRRRWGGGDAGDAQHDRSFFALLKKIVTLGRENEQLRNDVSSVQEDSLVYIEVARECEHKFCAEVAKNQEFERLAVEAEAAAQAAQSLLVYSIVQLSRPWSACNIGSAPAATQK